MASVLGNTEDNSEELAGKRKSQKSLKSRLFGKKRKEGEGERKLSQSVSNMEGDGLGSEEDLVSTQGALGSRALSHESIFVADQGSPGPEPPRVLSQENVHSSIKALQEKLQLQNMRLGPPPLVVPIKRQEDLGGSSEDDGLPHSPSETCQDVTAPRGGSYKAFSNSSSRPLSPIARPPPTRSMPLHSAPQSVVSPSTEPSTVDFSSPAQFTPCLDNSAARHRMSIKPRNQRASAKTRRLITNEARPRSESFNNFERPLSEKEEEGGLAVAKEIGRLRSFSTQVFGAGCTELTTSTAPPGSPLKTPEFTPLRSAPLEVTRSSSPTLHLSHRGSPQKHTLSGVSSPGPVTPQPLQKPVEPMTGKQPQPLFAQAKPELRERKEGTGTTPSSQALAANSGELKAPGPSPARRDHESSESPINPKNLTGSDRPSASLSAVEALKTSLRRGSQEVASPGEAGNSASLVSISQEDPKQPEAGLTGGLRKVASGPGTGSGSFKFSINSSRVEQERPRTGSLLGLMELSGTGLRKEDRERGAEMRVNPSNMSGQEQQAGKQERLKLREQPPDPLPESGDKATVGTARQGDPKPGVPPQNPVTSCDRREILRKDQSESSSPPVAMDTGVMEGEEVESHEGVEEAMEAKEEDVGKEEEAKAAFGVKLRCTSLSLKCRSEARAAEGTEPKVKWNSVEGGGTTLLLATSNPGSKSLVADKTSDQENLSSKKPLTNTSKTAAGPLNARTESFRQADPGATANPPSLKDVHIVSSAASPPAEGWSQASGPKEAQASPDTPHPDPQAATPEVSWMSFAMEKTRNFQQLFTSRLPREFPGMQQAAPQPQAQTQAQTQDQSQAQAQNQAQPQRQRQGQTQVFSQAKTQALTQSQTQKVTKAQTVTPQTGNASQPPSTKQLPAEIRTAAESQPTSQQQTAKLPQTPGIIQSQTQTPGQPKAATQTTKQPDTAKLPQPESMTQTAKQTAQPTIPQTVAQFSPRVSQTPQQPSLRTTQPFLRSLPQARGENTTQATPWSPLSSSPKSSPSQPPWNSRGLHSSPQPKATIPAQVSTTAPAPTPVSAPVPTLVPTSASAPAQVPASVLSPAPVLGRGERSGSFQRRGDGTTESEKHAVRTGTLGQRTAAFQEKSSDSTLSVGAKVELRRTALESTAVSKTVSGPETSTESSPTRVPGRLTDREDQCLPSSSPLQNISNSGQPSWMELAKRKSMAWSDKTMD
ncbi:mucin-5AC isoform X2 [Hypomesus transpacificus]|uniref:mucin-5AC isoform X2 n=1 Tax=Hypomesus transpacificus TaxID=137520 RepID=UPI001F079BA8|nr:mucin-5AC isoform X2 [Hypomesus transpacificus]